MASWASCFLGCFGDISLLVSFYVSSFFALLSFLFGVSFSCFSSCWLCLVSGCGFPYVFRLDVFGLLPLFFFAVSCLFFLVFLSYLLCSSFSHFISLVLVCLGGVGVFMCSFCWGLGGLVVSGV